ncbi:3-hydroxyacyl-CoA dehydrogenase [Sinomonas flava]|uniref:3-hydroxyacyl-CoA dehydrogenase n=1 Tax=Sinomonas flava TaxID=496857 RepID=UPI0039A5B769
MELQGASALITGGASGLGAATARRLHASGAAVVLLDLPGGAGEALAGELGDRAAFVPADVTDEDQVRAAVVRAGELGPLRVVVNCAGIATPGKVLGRDGVLPLAQFERVVRVNLIGTFNVIRLAADAMVATELVETALGGPERGVIVNTASVAAFDGQIGQPAYSASKGAVHAMTLPIARELARHLIRVVTIAPGIFETPMMAGLSQEAQDSLGKQVPHPARLGRPAEYANLVAHIVDNAMLNGETIRLDGAIRMAPK